MDKFHRGEEKLQEDETQVDLGKRYDLWEHRYEHSILKLLDYPELPVLSIVWGFQLNSVAYRHVEPRSAILMAAKCPRLQAIDISVNDNEKKDRDMRRWARHSMFTVPPGLRSARS